MNLKFKSVVTHWEREEASRCARGKNTFKMCSSNSMNAVHSIFEIPDSLDSDICVLLQSLKKPGQLVRVTIEIIETPVQKARRLLNEGKTKEAVAEALTILEGLSK